MGPAPFFSARGILPPMPLPSVFLVGPMGAGKSAVGRQLARLLGRQFFDSDAEIEARTGVDIAFIFEKEGEAGFRRREKDMIEELTTIPEVVVATGGGAVLDSANRAALASRGVVVYLEATVQQQLERTRMSRTRPLLEDPDPAARLAELMAVREPLYVALARITVKTDERRVREVAQDVRRRLGDLAGDH